MEQLTAAHRTLPFQTWVEVTNLSNGKQVDVRINDRGPFAKGRIIDLSQAAARDIDMLRAGTARVRLKVIAPPSRRSPAANASRDPPRVRTDRRSVLIARPAATPPRSANWLIAGPSRRLLRSRPRRIPARHSRRPLHAEARVVSNGHTPPPVARDRRPRNDAGAGH